MAVKQYRELQKEQKEQKLQRCEICCQADVRQCPNCKARIEKDIVDTGKAMRCTQCQSEYCWSCMTQWDRHQAWYMYCPELNNSMCCNIAVSILAILFMPIIMCLAPVIYFGMHVGLCWSCATVYGSCRQKKVPDCLSATFACLATIVVFPVLLLVGVVASLLACCFGTVPMQVLSFSYLMRVCSYTCKQCCRCCTKEHGCKACCRCACCGCTELN